MLTVLLTMLENDEDKNLLIEIYDKYKLYLLKVASDKLYDNSYIQDCIQDTFLELVYSFDNFKKITDEYKRKSYLITICKRCALKINNKSDNRCISFEEISDKELPVTDSFDFRVDDIDEISNIIINMPEKYSEPLIMKYADGYSLAEIGKKLGISENTVKQRIYRGKKYIISSLKAE